MTFVYVWAKFFILTLVLETAVAVPLLGPRESISRRSEAVIFAQLVTHPIAFFVLPELQLPILAYSLLAETWAVAAEFAFYRFAFQELAPRRALGVSAIANAVSYSVGLLLQSLP